MSNHIAAVSPDMLKLRLLASLIDAACADDDHARVDALQKRYVEVADQIFARALAGNCDGGPRAAAELIMAVFTMAKGGANV